MKKIVTLLSVLVCLISFLAVTVNGQWANNAPHIYNTNAGNVGISNGALWAPVYKLHVNTLNAGIATVMAESNYVGSPMRAIGYYRILNTATGDLLNISLRKNGANHEMLQSCFATGFGWREYTYLNYTTGKYEMRNGVGDAEFLNTGKFLISSTGNTGIGTINPLEKLEVNGAVRLGGTANNNPGTIQFNGANFLGFDGVNWLQLDNVNIQPPWWVMNPNPLPAPQNNPHLYPLLPPSCITTSPPALPNNSGWIYSTYIAAPALYPHQLTLEAIQVAGLPSASASQLYRLAPGPVPSQPILDISAGVYNMDLTYKVNVGPTLLPTSQSDGVTMLRAFPSGIVDLPNQSRARAYQVDPAGFNQMILPNVWTPVNFTMDAPPPQGYDEQNEFVLAPAANSPAPPELAFFVAFQEGYYQVNARVEFVPEFSQEGGPVIIISTSYVSIAIYTGPGPGATLMYAQGNNLQIGMPAGPMFYNNAPNVSDVVYLMPGQIISIWVFQSALTPMDLMQGPNKCYVSIHKVS